MIRFAKFNFDSRSRNNHTIQNRAANEKLPFVPRIAQHGKKGAISRTVFWTHEASTYLVRLNKKRLFLRVPNVTLNLGESKHTPVDTKHHALRNYNLMQLLNLVFPNNSIKPVGVAQVDYGGKKAFGVLSEIIKGRSKDYKSCHRNVYGEEDLSFLDDSVDAHTLFTQSKEVMQKLKQINSAGFSFEGKPWNMMNSNGNPIIVELHNVNPEKLLNYVRSLQKNPSIPKAMRSIQFRKRIELLLKQFDSHLKLARNEEREIDRRL